MSRHRKIKPARLLGKLQSLHPEHDDPDEFDSEFDEGPALDDDDDHAADLAADRYHRDMDARASQ